MLLGGPPGHVEPDLGDHLEGRGRVDPLDPGEIDAREAMEVLARIEGRGRASGLPRAGRVGQGPAPALVLESQELGLDLLIAGGDLCVVEVDEFQRLPELEEVLRAPGALERAGDRGRIALAVGVAQGGERAADRAARRGSPG